MRLLRCVSSLDPALGGVQEAIRQSCLGLEALGHSVDVVCLDDPRATWLCDYPATVHALGPLKVSLRRISLVPYGYSKRFVRWLRAHANKYDAVIVEGLWQFPSLGTWLALRRSSVPYFVVTHNMLDPWFRRRYPLKHLKKWSYWVLVERRVLRDAAAVVYLSETERAFGRKAFWPYGVRRELSAGLAIGTPPEQPDRQRRSFFERFPELQSRRLVLFMGRLHPVKGCDLLLDAFATVSDQDPQLHLVLAGPDPIGWKQVLQDRARDLGLEGKVTWAGMLTGDLKWGALRCAEVLVLPAHTEGFPVVVVEGMACGVPVLISNKVGIWREVYDTGGALIAEDDLQGTREMLAHYLRLSPNEKENMRRGARDGYLHQFEPSVVNGRFVSLLRDLGIADRSQERSR